MKLDLERLPPRLLAVADFFTEVAHAAWWLCYRAPHLYDIVRHGEPEHDTWLGFGERPGPKPKPSRKR